MYLGDEVVCVGGGEGGEEGGGQSDFFFSFLRLCVTTVLKVRCSLERFNNLGQIRGSFLHYEMGAHIATGLQLQ